MSTEGLAESIKRACKREEITTYKEIKEAARIAATELGIMSTRGPRACWQDVTELATGAEVQCMFKKENLKGTYLYPKEGAKAGWAWVRIGGGKPVSARVLKG